MALIRQQGPDRLLKTIGVAKDRDRAFLGEDIEFKALAWVLVRPRHGRSCGRLTGVFKRRMIRAVRAGQSALCWQEGVAV